MKRDNGENLKNVISVINEDLELLLSLTERLFDRDSAKKRFTAMNSPKTYEQLLKQLASDSSNDFVRIVLLELGEASNYIVKIIDKLPKTKSIVNVILKSAFRVVDETGYIAVKVSENVDSQIAQNLHKIKDEELRDMISEYLRLNTYLTNKIAQIYSESVND